MTAVKTSSRSTNQTTTSAPSKRDLDCSESTGLFTPLLCMIRIPSKFLETTMQRKSNLSLFPRYGTRPMTYHELLYMQKALWPQPFAALFPVVLVAQSLFVLHSYLSGTGCTVATEWLARARLSDHTAAGVAFGSTQCGPTPCPSTIVVCPGGPTATRQFGNQGY